MLKVQQNSIGAKLPAGILKGTEAFWYGGEKRLIHEGQSMKFSNAPVKLQNMIAETFLADTRSRDILRNEGITKFSEAFDRWYRCVIGALDEAPDFNNGNLNADAYNHMCTDYSCPLRGKLCSLATGLKNFEVETIIALKLGHSIEETAQMLCISLPGLKSRIEKLKEKLNATNMASLIANASKIGI